MTTIIRSGLLVSTLVSAGVLAGCVQTTAPTAPAVVAAAPGNCVTEVDALRADIANARLAGPRARRAQLDANSAAAACRAGRFEESLRLVSTARVRYSV